ncbi:Protein FAM188B [Symbiodinium microadriaticum]|uniref:Protein FAM188B n=1 Tax=Symbiodinium microadriaticum TaxID=2951 RepID=A0A1Q9EW20_SYMMI|nr:Protein FAM188B [Symbiodinium microadriaticum]CAE7939800.1 mindy4 [Symbiodinium sp. KB8]
MEDEPRRFFGPSKDVTLGEVGGIAPPRMGEPLNSLDAEALMSVVGPPELPEAWKQGFFFAGYQPYGLQQVNGGPCGVIAVVQAFLIRALHFRAASAAALLEVDESLRMEALMDAIAEVLFRNVGDNKKACVLVPSSPSASILNVSQLRCLQPALFTSYDQLRYFLSQRPYRDIFFNPSGCGVPLLLFSMVWTRTVEGCRERDFDDPKTGTMIGGHGYCTQELVNLMMFGRAYSNVFDGTKRLGSAKDGWMVLQGAPRRPNIGFLSLFEAYSCIEVGSRYKGPSSPIWVVCAESHYTVLFSADGSVNPQDTDKALDLFYFDQLGRQSERIRLTVIPKRLPAHLTTGFEESESMIDRCIRTKWKEATVDWNGSEIIL